MLPLLSASSQPSRMYILRRRKWHSQAVIISQSALSEFNPNCAAMWLAVLELIAAAPDGARLSLRRHKKQEHSRNRQVYKCGYCKMTFSKREIRLDHVRKFHAREWRE